MEEPKPPSQATANSRISVDDAGGTGHGPNSPALRDNSQSDDVLKFRQLFNAASQGTLTMSGTVVSESTRPPVTSNSRNTSTLTGFPSSASSAALSNSSTLTSVSSEKVSSKNSYVASLSTIKEASPTTGAFPSHASKSGLEDDKSASVAGPPSATIPSVSSSRHNDSKSPSISPSAIDSSFALLDDNNFATMPSSTLASVPSLPYNRQSRTETPGGSVACYTSMVNGIPDAEMEQTPESNRFYDSVVRSVQESAHKDERVITQVEGYPYMVLSRKNYLTTPLSEEKDLNYVVNQPFDWTLFFQRPVHQEKLSSVVLGLGFLADRKPLKLHSSTHSANKKIYSCENCFKFCLVFTCSKPQSGAGMDLNQFFLQHPKAADPTKDVDVTNLEHAPHCEFATKLNIPIWDVPFISDHVRETELEPFQEPKKVSPSDIERLLKPLKMDVGKVYSTVNAGLHRMRTKYRREAIDAYSKLPSYLRQYSRDNPTSFAVLQNDSDDSFLRCAVGIPNMALIFRNLCLPYIQIDGAHVKTELYDGVVVVAVAKLGDGSNIMLSMAYVPSETKVHLVWYLLILYYSGIPIQDIPIFSDRGNLIAATKVLKKYYNITLSLKFCLEHIFRNIVHQFKLEKEQGTQSVIRARLHFLQSAETFQIFRKECEITCEFQDSKDPAIGAKVVDYLLRIHPVHWTVFGNRPTSGGEEAWLRPYLFLILDVRVKLGDAQDTAKARLNEFVDRSLPRGKMFPLYYVSRNNQAESSANVLNKSGIRYCIPPVGIDRFITLAATRQMANYKEMVLRCAVNDQFLLPLGVKWWDKALSIYMQNQRTIPVTSFYKDEYAEMQVETRDGGTKKMEKVTIALDGCTCTCCDWEMTHSLCPDIKVCLAELPILRKPMYQRLIQVGKWLNNHSMFGDGDLGCMHAFGCSLMHPSVQTNKCLETLERITTPIIVPFQVGGQVHICDLTQPPQVYRTKRQGKKKGKRIKSKGESGKSTKSAARLHSSSPNRANRLTSQSYYVAKSIPRKEHTQSIKVLSQESFFDPCSKKCMTDAQVKAMVLSMLPSIRGPGFIFRHCGCCGDVTHTVRMCPEYMNGFRPHKPARELLCGPVIVCFLPPGWSARDALESLLNTCATDWYQDEQRPNRPVNYIQFMERAIEDDDDVSVLDDLTVAIAVTDLPPAVAGADAKDSSSTRQRRRVAAARECVSDNVTEIPVNLNIPPIRRHGGNLRDTTNVGDDRKPAASSISNKRRKRQNEGPLGVRDRQSALVAEAVHLPSAALVQSGTSCKSTNYRRRPLPTKSANAKDDGGSTLASSTVQQSQNVKAKLQLMSSYKAAQITSCKKKLFHIDEQGEDLFGSDSSSDSDNETTPPEPGALTVVESPEADSDGTSDAELSYDTPNDEEEVEDGDGEGQNRDDRVASNSPKKSPLAQKTSVSSPLAKKTSVSSPLAQNTSVSSVPPSVTGQGLKLRRTSPRRKRKAPESTSASPCTPVCSSKSSCMGGKSPESSGSPESHVLTDQQEVQHEMKDRFNENQIKHLFKYHLAFPHVRRAAGGRSLRVRGEDEDSCADEKEAGYRLEVLEYLDTVKSLVAKFDGYVRHTEPGNPIWDQEFRDLERDFFKEKFFAGGDACFGRSYGVRIRRTLLSRLSDSTSKYTDDLPKDLSQRYISTDIIDIFVQYTLDKLDHEINVTGTAKASAKWPVLHNTCYTWGAQRVTCKEIDPPRFDGKKVWRYATRFLPKGKYNPKGVHVFPVCEGKHWFLMILDFRKKNLVYVDPMGGTEDDGRETEAYHQMRALLAVIMTPSIQTTRAKSRKHSIETKLVPELLNQWNLVAAVLPKECRQTDITNCGVFVVMLIDAMKHDANLIYNTDSLSPEVVSTEKAEQWRHRLFWLILHNCKSPFLEE